MGPLRQDVVSTVLPKIRTNESSRAKAWRVALPLLLLVIALVVVLYWGTILAMVSVWYRSETFTHGFVVLPIVLWLVWRKREQLALQCPRANGYFLLPLAAIALMWLLGDLVAVNSVTQFAVVAMLVAAVPAVLGARIALAIAFPLAFMFFAVPVGEFMMPRLMDWTAAFTILALRASGIPVYQEGLNFVIPSGNWSVVEACSGVRYLIASVTVGTLYAYLNYQSLHKRLLFVGVAILVPVVANWLRAYMIVMLGHYSGNTLAVGVDHLIYGWVFFGIVILLMFLVGARWADPDPVGVASAGNAGAVSQAEGSARKLWLVAAAFVLIASLPILGKHQLEANRASAPVKLLLSDSLSPTWQKTDAADLGYKPQYENPSAEFQQTYAGGDQPVGIYLGYYRDQDYSRKLVSSSNVLVTSGDPLWASVRQGTTPARLDGKSVTLRSAELRRLAGAVETASGRLRVWQIYWINGLWTSNDYLAKVYGAVFQLLGRGDDSAVLVVYTGSDGADRALGAFLADNHQAIDKALRAAAAGR